MKKEIIKWNNLFPLDRWWRLKYRIPYSSSQHQEVSQVDIFFEYYEEILFNQYLQEEELNKEKDSLLSEGILLTSRSRSVEEDLDMFDNLDITNFNFE